MNIPPSIIEYYLNTLNISPSVTELVMMLSASPRARFLVSGLGHLRKKIMIKNIMVIFCKNDTMRNNDDFKFSLQHLDPHIGALEVLEGDTLLLWNFLALVPILRATLLVRHLGMMIMINIIITMVICSSGTLSHFFDQLHFSYGTCSHTSFGAP